MDPTAAAGRAMYPNIRALATSANRSVRLGGWVGFLSRGSVEPPPHQLWDRAFGTFYCSGNTYKRMSGLHYQYVTEADPPDQYFRSPVRGSSSTSGVKVPRQPPPPGKSNTEDGYPRNGNQRNLMSLYSSGGTSPLQPVPRL